MDLSLLLWLIPLPPLISFALIVLFANRSRPLSHTIALTSVLISFALSAVIVFSALTSTPLHSAESYPAAETAHSAETPAAETGHTTAGEQTSEGEHAMAEGGHAAHPIFASKFNWLPTGDTWFTMGVMADQLTVLMLVFVPLAIVLIFLYSIGYHNFGKKFDAHDLPGNPPHGGVEPMYARFFAYLSLFAAGMLTLVVADNLLLLFVGWEVMGYCSYSLIGFWYGRQYDDPKATPPRKAAIKAFMTTRVADVFMMLGIVYLYSQTGTLNFHDIFFNPEVMTHLLETPSLIGGFAAAHLIGLLLFIGTVGKSAQFPLHVWLPDAMEGPTPVSAMIHAAAMVSAGIYMIARMFPVLAIEMGGYVAHAAESAGHAAEHAVHSGNPTLSIMAFIGAFTALFAATIAVAQKDVKKVLAYSTISQLGFMVAALGIQAYVPAVFHLMTHAFFKALLFMGSGSIIHGMEHGIHHTHRHIDPQDMFNMGGLRKKMPTTFITFLIGGLALSGFPFITAGFWSKDEILGEAFAHGHYIVFTVLCIAAFLTAFYTMRQISLTFFGKPRTPEADHAHESAWTMTTPLVILSFFAIFAGFVGVHGEFPVLGQLLGNNPLEHWLHGSTPAGFVGAFKFSWFPVLASIAVGLGGLFLGWWVYGRKPLSAGQVDPVRSLLGPIYTLLENKYYIDEFYDWAFVKPTHWIGEKLVFNIMDRGILDGIIHAVAFGAMGTGQASATAEKYIIDTPPNKLADFTRWVGRGLRYIQTGSIQTYLLYTLLAMVLVVVVYYFFPR
jgi:NADH-quinone oxidoreductase subunit L